MDVIEQIHRHPLADLLSQGDHVLDLWAERSFNECGKREHGKKHHAAEYTDRGVLEEMQTAK